MTTIPGRSLWSVLLSHRFFSPQPHSSTPCRRNEKNRLRQVSASWDLLLVMHWSPGSRLWFPMSLSPGKLPFFFIYLSWVGPWSWVTEVERSMVILVWKEFLSLPTAQQSVKGWKFACDFSSLNFLFSPTLFLVPGSSPSGLFWAPVAEAPQQIGGWKQQCQDVS